MSKTAALTMITLMGVAVLGCEVEEQDTTPAAEEDLLGDRTPALPQDGEQPATIEVDSLADTGPYITDGEGRALYAIEGEPEGESTCYDECASEWPPFLASDGADGAGGADGADGASAGEPTPGAPGAGPAEADRIGTLERRDGQRQVTYEGRALYYYHDDQEPGETDGHHLTDQWGEWYLVRPDGELLEGHEDGAEGQGES